MIREQLCHMPKTTRYSVNHYPNTLVEDVWAWTKTICAMRATSSSHPPFIAVFMAKTPTTTSTFNLPLSQSPTIMSSSTMSTTIVATSKKVTPTLTTTSSIKKALSLSRNEIGHFEWASSFLLKESIMADSLAWATPSASRRFFAIRRELSFWDPKGCPKVKGGAWCLGR